MDKVYFVLSIVGHNKHQVVGMADSVELAYTHTIDILLDIKKIGYDECVQVCVCQANLMYYVNSYYFENSDITKKEFIKSVK